MKNIKTSTRHGMQWFLFMSFAVMFFSTAIYAAQANKNNLIFILDASGSMWGQVENFTKISIAKDVLTNLINDLPQNLNVGLVVYGHKRKAIAKMWKSLSPWVY